MSKEKLTPWFPADVKPARKGSYQREYDSRQVTEQQDYWDGRKWILLDAFGKRIGTSAILRPWRGLASDPAATAK